jgi:pimeloyl-ACP methyl ester carboxylesterase
LVAVLGDARRIAFSGSGHMGPVTDPQPVNEAIAAFLTQLPG